MERYTVPSPASITPEHITIRPIFVDRPIVERIIQTEPLPVARPVEPVVVTEHHHTHTEREVIHVRELRPTPHSESPTQSTTPSRSVNESLQPTYTQVRPDSPALVTRPEIPVEAQPIKEPVGMPENQIVPEKKIKESEPEKSKGKSNQESPKNQRENQRPFEKKSKVTLILARPETAQGAEKPKFFKKVGRQRTEEKTKDVIVYRLLNGKWPHGLSDYMQWYYNVNYVQTKGKQYAKTRQWKAEIKTSQAHASRPGAHIVPIFRRASA